MSKTRFALMGASTIAGFLLIGASAPIAFAASTIVQNDIQGYAMCRLPDGSNTCDQRAPGADFRFYFTDPSISVQYQAGVTDDSGQVIVPGGSVSCGKKVTLSCGVRNNSDIYWASSGGSYDTPYGTWGTTGSSCSDQYYVTTAPNPGPLHAELYANLSLNPPSQTISGTTGLTDCQTLSDGCSMTCTAVNTGDSPVNVPIVFNYGATTGMFYGSALWDHVAGKPCFSMSSPLIVVQTSGKLLGLNPWNSPITKEQGTPTVPIPSAQIPYAITITPNGSGPSCAPSTTPPPSTTPNTPPPTPLTLSAGPGSAACTLGTPYSITMSASDAQGTGVRYLIDWNNDGVVDQIVPPSGYLPLGTPQNASRTYVSEGSKTVAVMVQDDKGNTTAWTSFSFQCAPADTSGGTGGQCDPTIDCTCNNSCSTGNGNQIQTDLNLSVVPSLVGRGETTTINWSSTNMTSCTVTATNGDTWTDLQSPIGGETSSVINQATTYTLTCAGLDGITKQKQATVKLVPVFCEPGQPNCNP